MPWPGRAAKRRAPAHHSRRGCFSFLEVVSDCGARAPTPMSSIYMDASWCQRPERWRIQGCGRSESGRPSCAAAQDTGLVITMAQLLRGGDAAPDRSGEPVLAAAVAAIDHTDLPGLLTSPHLAEPRRHLFGAGHIGELLHRTLGINPWNLHLGLGRRVPPGPGLRQTSPMTPCRRGGGAGFPAPGSSAGGRPAGGGHAPLRRVGLSPRMASSTTSSTYASSFGPRTTSSR